MLENWTAGASPGEPDQRMMSRQFQRALDPRTGQSTRRRLERDLRAAVVEDGLVLYYQPRLALASGAVVGAEALLRWPHPRQGLISPATFIPIAERTELVHDIARFVLRSACTEAMQWPTVSHNPPPRVSVNISARQLADHVLLEQLSEALEVSRLPPERLELEFAESMLVETELETLLTLSAIRDLGVGLTLDDFGVGPACLSVLRRLPLTVLKIDRSLVRGLPADREDAAIVRAMVAIAHTLDLGVAAGGIETEAQRAFLAGIGCDEGQGFLFSHPQPAAALATRMLLVAGS